MALPYHTEAMYNSSVDNSTNKVYINPNFNRPTSNNHTSNAMHINPRFSHLLSNVQPIPQNKTRIYVNPNFKKLNSASTNLVANTICVQQTTVNNYVKSVHLQEQPKIQEEKHNITAPITKSRYSLVRQNVSTISNKAEPEKPKSTYQVNKYKSIPLKDMKKSLDNAKNTINNASEASWTKPSASFASNKKYSSSATSDPNKNRYKLVNSTAAPLVRNDIFKIRIEMRRKGEIRQKKKWHLKKNNIPCPTFRKFGKCLRQIQGKCDFLHDKKHVSICRKFIKGLCHDKECLLSHDLTAKKMPTCYFYLQGTCTKPDCPYLHVKLSEKVKICPDFLKGYCEKGSKCLQRHVQPENHIKRSLVRKVSSSSKKKHSKIKASNVEQTNTTITQEHITGTVTEKNENSNDYRYYQEHSKDVDDTSETCNIIKPMRCKLGTLPSFIQL